MRIAHFVQRYPPALGGSEAYFARLGRFLVEAGHEVTVFTTAAFDLEAFWNPRGRCLPPGRTIEHGVEVRRYSLVRFPGKRWVCKLLSLIPYPPWQRLCLGHNPLAPEMWRDAGSRLASFDAVHASALPYGYPLACGLRLARTLKVPFVLTPFLHVGDPDDAADRTRSGYLQPALMSLLRAADAIFVQTNLERQALLDAGLVADKLVLQGMGVDPQECTGGNRDRTRREWGMGHDEVVIGHLANQSEEKGTCDLLRAAAICWQRGTHFRIVLAGPEMPNFRRFWREFPHADRVRRLGILSDEQKRDFFAALDAFALPSRSDSFGLVLLEAWANGIPNIAYRAGGIAEVIRHEQDGLLVRCGDVAGLADALQRMWAGPLLRQSLGAEGQRRCSTEFRWRPKFELVEQTLQRLKNTRSTK